MSSREGDWSRPVASISTVPRGSDTNGMTKAGGFERIGEDIPETPAGGPFLRTARVAGLAGVRGSLTRKERERVSRGNSHTSGGSALKLSGASRFDVKRQGATAVGDGDIV